MVLASAALARNRVIGVVAMLVGQSHLPRAYRIGCADRPPARAPAPALAHTRLLAPVLSRRRGRSTGTDIHRRGRVATHRDVERAGDAPPGLRYVSGLADQERALQTHLRLSEAIGADGVAPVMTGRCSAGRGPGPGVAIWWRSV